MYTHFHGGRVDRLYFELGAHFASAFRVTEHFNGIDVHVCFSRTV